MTALLNQEYSDILVDHAFGLFALLNTKGEVIKLNQQFLDLLGLTQEESIGKSFFNLSSDDIFQRDLFQQNFETVCQFGKPVHFESSVTTPLGKLTINTIFSPVQNELGETNYVIAEGRDISQQKIYEQQLAGEQAFVKAVLDNTADGIISYDAEGNRTYSNAVAKKMFAIDSYPYLKESGLENVFDLYIPDSDVPLTKNETPLGLALQGTEVKNLELRIQAKDSLPKELSGLKESFTTKDLSVNSRIIRNKSKEVANVVTSYNDITQQKESELARTALQERFNHAFDNAVIGIGILSSTGLILEANNALASMLDYDQKELVGKTFGDITHPDDLTLTDILFSEIEVGARNSVYYEKKLKNKKGRAVVSIIGISVSRSDNGTINYLIAHFLDVTENNKISKALALSQENYQSIFNSQLDAVIVTNLSGKILNINPSAVKLFGYKIEEIDGLMFWELFSAKEDQLSVFNNLYTEEQEKIHTDNIRYAHRNGDAFPAETVGFVIFDGDGERLGYTWIIQDVSEKKIAEITLARINQRLAVSREEERRRLARELHDGIVQDLMGFSYELASLEGLLDRKDDFTVDADDLKDMRGKLTDSIKQLRSFISDLRPVGLEEFGFQSALESYVALLERDRQSMRAFPKITLKVDDVGDLPIPINLCLFRSAQEGLSNIIRHANAKNVVVKLVIKQTKTTSLVLTIKDDGVGFKVPEDIDDFSDSQHFGLIGINERVTLMDGHLAIKSQKNKGTTLTLTLPYEMDN